MRLIAVISALELTDEYRDDVFALEFPDPSDARAARRAAELDASGSDRPSIGRRLLARGLAIGTRRGHDVDSSPRPSSPDAIPAS